MVYRPKMIARALKLQSQQEFGFGLVKVLQDSFKRLQHPGDFRRMHGIGIATEALVPGFHGVLSVLEGRHSAYSLSHGFLDNDAGRSALGSQSSSGDRKRAEYASMREVIVSAVRDADLFDARREYAQKFRGDVVPLLTTQDIHRAVGETVWVPAALRDLDVNGYYPQTRQIGLANWCLSEAKTQDRATGVVTRTTRLNSALTDSLPSQRAKNKLLKVCKTLVEPITAYDAEFRAMQDFAEDVWRALKVFKNTKQLQEGWPEIFDDFVALSGLGACHGSDLLPHNDVSNVNNIIADFHKSR
jgi:hypothetical protein